MAKLLINKFYYRTHGNTHKQPHNAFTVKDVQHVKSFITSYAEENAISLPGRIPGYKDYKILLLPSDKSKHAIHCIYQVKSYNSHQINLNMLYITYTRMLLLPPLLEV